MKGTGPPEQRMQSQFRFQENYSYIENRWSLSNEVDMLIYSSFLD